MNCSSKPWHKGNQKEVIFPSPTDKSNSYSFHPLPAHLQKALIFYQKNDAKGIGSKITQGAQRPRGGPGCLFWSFSSTEGTRRLIKFDNPSMSFVNTGGKRPLMLGGHHAQEYREIPLRQELGQEKGLLYQTGVHSCTSLHPPTRPKNWKSHLEATLVSVPHLPSLSHESGRNPDSLSSQNVLWQGSNS